jgi:enoyl-CoA hydratase/carnithine racemase
MAAMSNTNTEPLVMTEHKGTILIVTLNRPSKSNSLHPDLVAKLSQTLTDAEGDAGVNVMILTGAGRSFCAGLDLELLVSWTVEEKMAYLSSVTMLFQKLWTMPQPVIAAVNGPAIAGGFDLAAFCDIRLAANEAVFGQAEINLGLTQIIHPLYKSIGLARAKELAMTGQNISAEEAYRIGLVNHIYPRERLMENALEMAGVLASKPRNALFETKRLTRELIDLDTKKAMGEMTDTFRRCLQSEETRERIAQVYALLKSKS